MAAKGKPRPAQRPPHGKPSSLLGTDIIYCGDCLDQLRKVPDACVDLISIGPPYNTGNEKWVYNNAVNSPEMRDLQGKVVRVQGHGVRAEA